MKSQGMLISAFAFALVIAIFAVINVEQVEVNFMFAKTSTPLILVILVSTLLGGLTVGLFGMLRIFKLQRQVKTLEKSVAEQAEQSDPFEATFASDAGPNAGTELVSDTQWEEESADNGNALVEKDRKE
ncbi:LapA family protein [Paenibacillus agaridevorans]|uniref:LapA family protein n=1 Tax=Paenibacillus agaridevorans TaxID=171404 RepID=UPI001BE3DA4C|nr:lipopolysaccharide assembly protein LapA domain-containing protein [Paenibacillus agaridevorans]